MHNGSTCVVVVALQIYSNSLEATLGKSFSLQIGGQRIVTFTEAMPERDDRHRNSAHWAAKRDVLRQFSGLAFESAPTLAGFNKELASDLQSRTGTADPDNRVPAQRGVDSVESDFDAALHKAH